MDEIEVSIGLSMNGTSYQPQQQQQKVPLPATSSAPKVIYNTTGSVSGSTSTTPTDVMDVSSAYVC